uniref:Coiled-coil domain containing 105 n=1 Tax=Vombatus ursinus TaxID=29139 RepID=A0A4X2M8G1_VOMUR
MPVFLHPLEPAPEDRVGPPEWRQHTRDTVTAAQQLTERCGANALSVWQPRESISDPNIDRNRCRKTYMLPWRFRAEMLKDGGTVEQPPPGDGVTLWKEKLKPPAWLATIPLPLNREARAMQSNEYIQNYGRGVRLLAARLRQAEQEINEQLRAVFRQRETTDRRLSEIRKGLLINEQSRKIRLFRPASEKVPDKADTLLLWEKEELQGLKRKLEKDMEASEILLKALSKCRDDLTFCCEERLQVVDLMNHCLDAALVEAGRQSWINISRVHTPKVQGTASPPVNPVGVNPPGASCPSVGTLFPHLPETQSPRNWTDLHPSSSNVVSGLSSSGRQHGKERLNMMAGLTRGTIHRCQKFKEEILITKGLNKGPVCQKHLETREKLERPMVRVFQRHVGTQLPEANHLSMGTEKLTRHAIKMDKDLEKLIATRKHLNTCLRDKKIGHQVDYDVLRLRLRESHPHMNYEQVQRMGHY